MAKKHAKKADSTTKVETSSVTEKSKQAAKKVKTEDKVTPVSAPVVKTLGAPGSVVPGSPSHNQLEAVVKEAVAAKVPAKVIVSDPADLSVAQRLIDSLNPELPIGVVLKESFGGRATWRALKS